MRRVRVRLRSGDRRAAVAGAVTLVVLAVSYPLYADAAARPLAVFVLPALLTAVLGGWRPTALVGAGAIAVAVVTGVLGPLDATALAARLSIVVIGTLMGALGAAVREAQSDRLLALDDAVSLRAAFERALAPAPIAPPGFRAVSRYEPAEARMHLGGDFVEGVALADGRFAVLIGDVCGHGPREAAFGSALRAGWKAIALGGGDPVEWVDSLEAAFFRDGRIDTYATVCTGWMDRNVNLTRLVTLGHPPPIALSGRPTVLDVAPAPPLGIGLHQQVVATEVRWSGSPLLFYSDGLIENPRRGGSRPDRWGTDGLLGWLAAQQTHGDIDRVADDLVAAALHDRERRDDVAVLIVAGAIGAA